MTTARDIITKALTKIGANFKNNAVSSDEANDALDALNALVSSYANDSMLIYARQWEMFTLSPSDGLYTMGVGGDFNTDKPMFIVSAYLRDGITDYPLSIIKDELYNEQISQKSTISIPYYINSDNGHPLVNLRLYPIPDKTYQIFLLTEKQLSEFTLDTDVILPAGWERMLIYNLAIELYPEYEQQVNPVVAAIAEESKRLVRANIMRNRTMDYAPQRLNVGRFENGWLN